MKNLLQRIRRWFIKKLGGYVDPPGTPIPIPGPQKVTLWSGASLRERTICPAKIEVCTSVDSVFIVDAKRSGVDATERINHILSTEMVKILLNEGLVRLSRTDNPNLKDCVYRGTIFVIRPEDAGLFGYRESEPGEWEEP